MNYSKRACILLLLLVAGACDKRFIELSPVAVSSAGNFYKTEADMVNAINGTYSILQRDGLYGREHLFGDIISDDASTVSGVCILGYCDFDNFSIAPNGTAASDRLNARWSDAYAGIYRTNAILNRISGATMTETVRTRVTGEAKFLRGLFYFTLVRTFGDVPLVLKELESAESFGYGREASAKIYEQILIDLNEAATALPATYATADLGRATTGAANALLGTVYLTLKNYTEAEKVLKKVVDANTHTLLPNYADVFATTNANNQEIVFAVQYKRTNGEGSVFNTLFAPENSGSAIANAAQGALVPTDDLVKSFEKGDKRLDVSIATYTYTNGTTRLYTKKYFDPGAPASDADNDWPVFRYSDVLLMYGEALNETNKTTLAETLLNTVRARAGLSAKAGLTQAAIRIALAQERRVELCFEGHRWWDLTRTNMALSVMNQYFANNNITSGGNVVKVKDNQLFFPIPQNQIDINAGKITQNPGY
ncbi:MAG: RagB/SusD family nutrient uptake outer membrane protein [Bacteroidetes bacterium]|nr:RagB/SusD family nutrient uptake outer membrane protein [Fibrella sp.]